MNIKFSLLAALVAGFLPMAAAAQAAPAASQPAASAAAPAAVPSIPPSAFPAKVALVNFLTAVEATNEGQRVAMEVAKKYQPEKDKLEALAADVDSLKKKLQAAPASLSDEERNRQLKEIDTKEKQLQRDGDDATNSFQTDMNEALSKVADKVHSVMVAYVARNGYTLLLNVGDQQASPVIWASQDQNADITEAVVEEYNKTSGISAPPPAAPAASAPARPRPSTTTPHTATPAKPAQ